MVQVDLNLGIETTAPQRVNSFDKIKLKVYGPDVTCHLPVKLSIRCCFDQM